MVSVNYEDMSRVSAATESPPVWLDNGVRVGLAAGDGAAGDPVEAYVGDDRLGLATLRRERRGRLSARIPLAAPLLGFPARLRVMNARLGREIGGGLALADADALLAAAGPPELAARFLGWRPDGLAFAVTFARECRYPRAFDLTLASDPPVAAWSVAGECGLVHRLTFPLDGPVPTGTAFTVTERRFAVSALAGVFDADLIGAGAAARLDELADEVAALRRETESLRRRLDAAVSLGRDTLLLERLDLFYLLLCERAAPAAVPAPAPEPEPAAPTVRHLGPAGIDGIGIFDVETDGTSEWRWFGPDATIALRDLTPPVRRVLLHFHRFCGDGTPPAVRVSTGGPPEPARVRAMEDRHVVEVPVRHGALVGGAMLVVHVSFDRHATSAADPRLLSAVFCGAEIVSGAA
jgi:hypothetical protein